MKNRKRQGCFGDDGEKPILADVEKRCSGMHDRLTSGAALASAILVTMKVEAVRTLFWIELVG